VDFLTVETESGSSELHRDLSRVYGGRRRAKLRPAGLSRALATLRRGKYREPVTGIRTYPSCLPTSTATVPPLNPGTAGGAGSR
jgi:hypothetical protein